MDATTMKQWFHTAGWLSRAEAEMLYLFAKEVSPSSSIIEIGSHLGKSTCVLGGAVKDKGIKIYCIDPWTVWNTPNDLGEESLCMRPRLSDKDMARSSFEQFKENVAHLDNIVICRGLSRDVMPTLDVDVQMIFIDGNHEYESVKEDLVLALNKKPRFILCHDYANNDHEGVTDAALEVFGRPADLVADAIGVWGINNGI